MTWTKFDDMYSGGSQKLNWSEIYVNLPINEAKEWFIQTFEIDPKNVTCDCCGVDFYIVEVEESNVPTGSIPSDVLVIDYENLNWKPN